MNPKTKFADWVAYKVEPKNLNGLNKQRVWREDPKLKPEYSFSPKDYEGGNKACGYDRGHQAPLANFSNNQHADQTNYLSNITPQMSKLNRGAWKRLEDKERLLAKKNKGEVTNEARTKFAEIIDNSLRNPIAIARHGRVVSIVMAKEEYDHYQEMEEQWWMNYKTIPSTDVSDEVNSRIAKLEQQLAKISNV
ncbi:unnamed protein product [Rotaria magnacalcarata]|uniref:Endonuclease n=1 Tax=Rotaria magnacalcarata TaxID=392030 RepID=A0A818YZL2_9BILA|nr:unnamed protein product [Rotaria magnacalcarata]